MTQAAWRIHHIDLSQGPPKAPEARAPRLLVFWWGGLPLGRKACLADEPPLDPAQMRSLCARFAAEQLQARASGMGLPRAGLDAAPLEGFGLGEAAGATDLLAALDRLATPARGSAEALSVVVCTRDRPEMLGACIDSLEAQASPPSQIIVVDNSTSGSARPVVEDRATVTYVFEPRPGLSVARNAGLAAARGQFVAFTDDDVELPASWTREIVSAFDAPDVDAVTGLVLPASLDTPAQRAFELELGGFTQRYAPLLFDAAFLERTRDVGPQVWRIGAGANMAFRRSSLIRWGDFDERLGAGASGCSEDSEFWYRILAAGGVCLYEPRAVVFHHHRSDWRGLQRQYRAYMRGHVAALVAQHDRYGNRGDLRRIFRQLPAYFSHTALKSIQNLSGWRLRLLANEVGGWLLGLQYLIRPRWRRQGLATTDPTRPERAAGSPHHA